MMPFGPGGWMWSRGCSRPSPTDDLNMVPSPALWEKKLQFIGVASIHHLARKASVELCLQFLLGSTSCHLPAPAPPPPPLLCYCSPHIDGIPLLLCDLSQLRIHLAFLCLQLVE